jgi:hypothetical protein
VKILFDRGYGDSVAGEAFFLSVMGD